MKERRSQGGFINVILVLLIIAVLILVGYFFYQNLPGAPQSFNIGSYNFKLGSENLINASSEISQFVPNMRFNHKDISYFINPECSNERITRMRLAFSIISEDTGIINFHPTGETDADIVVGCSQSSYQQEKNVFTAGEGGPTGYLNLSYYPLILKGKIILYQKPECSQPLVEIHELLHVFGFAHVNNKTSVMYPYSYCSQQIDPEIINILKQLYSIEPAAELFFTEINVSKSGIYLDFNFSITNQGLEDAKDVTVDISGDNIKIDSTDMGSISIGQTESIVIRNMKLPSRNIKNLIFSIAYNGNEFNKNNNELKLSV